MWQRFLRGIALAVIKAVITELGKMLDHDLVTLYGTATLSAQPKIINDHGSEAYRAMKRHLTISAEIISSIRAYEDATR